MHRWYTAQKFTSPSDAFLSTWLVQECWLSYCKISICHVYCAHHKMISLCALGWIPYSGELLREKTFANWWKIWFSRWKLSQIARFYCAKGCHAPKFYRENLCKYPQNWNSRKFSPSKVSHYTVLTRNVFGPSVATLSCARKGRENLCLFVYFVTSFWSSCTKWTSASAVQTNNWAKFIILLVWWASARTWRDHYHHVSSLFCSETVSQVQTEKEALSRHTSASSQKEKGCVSAEREEIGACIGLHG